MQNKDLPLRIGVGIVVLNKNNKVFVGKRIDNPIDKWQMPQGGVDPGETFTSAMKRELLEETSIQNIKIGVSESSEVTFNSKNETITFDGFLRVYNEGTDDEIEEEKGVLPVLSINENLNLLSISSRESFSRPPSRFTEASLVKKLEIFRLSRVL